jgi:hypothetical protein
MVTFSSQVIHTPRKKAHRRTKINVFHTPEGEEVWDVTSEEDI